MAIRKQVSGTYGGGIDHETRQWMGEVLAAMNPHAVTPLATNPAGTKFQARCRTCGEIGEGTKSTVNRVSALHAIEFPFEEPPPRIVHHGQVSPSNGEYVAWCVHCGPRLARGSREDMERVAAEHDA